MGFGVFIYVIKIYYLVGFGLYKRERDWEEKSDVIIIIDLIKKRDLNNILKVFYSYYLFLLMFEFIF